MFFKPKYKFKVGELERSMLRACASDGIRVSRGSNTAWDTAWKLVEHGYLKYSHTDETRVDHFYITPEGRKLI